MSKELVISANRHETKVAILEDDQLVEVFFQRANEYSLAGSIHKGRVTRVLPGMQSAFVDLGLERDAFLYVSDFFEDSEEFDRVPISREEPGRRPAPSAATSEPLEAIGEKTEVEEETSSAAASGAGSPSAAPQDRYDGGEGRDRRGRRSRRRRNRGRGFPESKYASAEPRPVFEVSREARTQEAAPLPEPAGSTSESQAAAGDFAVLPGESLAKYSHTNIQPLDEAEEEEIRSLQESEGVPEPEAGVEAILDAEEPASEAILISESETEISELIPVADEFPRAAATAEPLSEVEPPAETVAAAEPETDEPSGSSEIQAALEADAVVQQESAAAAPAESDNPPAQLTAQVREQGGRYPHRMTRRMRRKMRGGERTERGERGEAAPSAAEGSLRKPEQARSISRPDKGPAPSIAELLKEGQEIIVQIAKEPLGQKGARITSHIALPGRYVVYMPTLEHTGVSRKIASDEERHRLKRILQVHHAGIAGGFIVRTAGEGKSEEDIAADMNFLANLWLDIRQKAEKKPAPVLLHHDLDIVQRTLRDQVTDQFKDIWVDNEEMYENVLSFMQRFQPGLVNRVKLYTRSAPIFDAFNITAELEKALRPKVWLKSGGYIVINQTEALVAIDVNTGKYVGRSNRLEDTIVKTNTEAVKEIVRQVRLRDLGGIIVVDFIDMDERKNRQKVMQALEDAMRADRAPYKILQFNDFGLVAITRKRVKQSLERALCMACPHCEGAGYVKSVQTIVSEILQEAHKIADAMEGKDVLLRAHPDVARYLKSSQNKYLEELEEVLRRPVLVKGDPLLHHEKFDLT